jgi:peptidoglycan glycosyltransferase
MEPDRVSRRIRVLGLVLLACFVLLFLQLNNLQIREGPSLRANPDNPSQNPVATWYQNPRGELLASDGTVLADSIRTRQGYERRYPDGPLYADVTGYYDATAESTTGLDDEYDGYLTEHQSSGSGLQRLLVQQVTIDSVVTTISPTVQQAAEQAVGNFRGAVVAIDPATGDIEAMYSSPSFNPNGMSSLNARAANDYYNSLDPNSGSSPLVNGATHFLIQPGSTFKVITTASIFDHDPSIASIAWPYASFIHLPQTTKTLQNYAGEVCGGSLATALAVSCDTAYAQIGMDLGAQNLATEASAFGFNKVPPIDLPGAVAAYFPPASTIADNKPATAYSAIGQENVQETPLEDALVAAAIADGGKIMAPHLLERVVSDTGQIVKQYQPHVWLTATSPSTANTVRSLMLGVATHGTAEGVFPSYLDVAAKTGTAETGVSGCSADWMIATGPAGTGQTPKIAVAAVLPAQAGISCSETGAEAAGPIVEKVLTAAGG